VLVDLGYVSVADITKALGPESQKCMGLGAALAGGELSECMMPAGIENLHVMPLGSAEARHAGTVSPTALRRLVEAARQQFDVVLIDTGPFLGSLEAAAVASVSDGVVLVVSRGEQRLLAERCIRQLNAIGAALCGMVFNRARPQDVTAASYSSSIILESRQSRQKQGERAVVEDMGSMADAVAASTRKGDAA
jgi:polysaccharide biosynthesis transport protein